MKYLKRYNESISNNIVYDVKDILLEISDMGFECICRKEGGSVDRHPGMIKDQLFISIKKNVSDSFKYSDVLETFNRLFNYLKSKRFKQVIMNDGTSDWTIDEFIPLFNKIHNKDFIGISMVFKN